MDYEDLAISEGGFRIAVAEYIRSYIYASGLNEYYYDDFESYLFFSGALTPFSASFLTPGFPPHRAQWSR